MCLTPHLISVKNKLSSSKEDMCGSLWLNSVSDAFSHVSPLDPVNQQRDGPTKKVSPVSNYLSLPTTPARNPSTSTSRAITGARVLTSAECLSKKRKRKRRREAKKQQREEEKRQKLELKAMKEQKKKRKETEKKKKQGRRRLKRKYRKACRARREAGVKLNKAV